MAGRTHARPLDAGDLDVLESLDRAYAEAFGLERVVSAGSLSFYARSGHAFVAERAGEARGFVLAHAVWNGLRPVVQASRLVSLPDDGDSRRALLEALTKSAYDAAVYDVQVMHPLGDEAGKQALENQDYAPQSVLLFTRVLGSRGQKGS